MSAAPARAAKNRQRARILAVAHQVDEIALIAINRILWRAVNMVDDDVD